MKKIKNKAFTLIELLAVIVVLAIILAVAVPRVISVVENSRKEALKISVESLVRGGKQIAKIEETSKTFTITNGAFVGESIPMTGTLPNSATIVIREDETVAIVAKTDKYCYIKDYDDEDMTLVDEEDCSLPTVAAKIYGVTFNNTTVGTRTDDAVGMTYTVNASTIDSSFDTAEIYSEMTEEIDSYGNVFIKIPRFYIKKTKSAGNIWTYKISKDQVDSEYYLPECFKNQTTGDILDYVLIGKYLATVNGTNMESKAGAAPKVYTNRRDFRTYAMNNGTGYQIIDIHAIDLIQVLFYVEFATLDSQSIMSGISYSWNAPVNGTTDSVTTASGSPLSNTDGKNPMKYRGIESLYGREWQLVDGINIKNHQVYVSNKPESYTGYYIDALDDYETIGYLTASNDYNYISELGYDPNHPYANYPISVGSEATSIYKDFFSIGKTNDYSSIAMYGGSYGFSETDIGINNWNFGSYQENMSASCCPTATSRLMKKAY